MLRFFMIKLIGMACIFLASSTRFASADFVILFSNSSNGILSSCYCPSAPWGGLAKRAWLVDEIRTVSGPDSVLLVDTGDLFPVIADIQLQSLLLSIYDRMQYDAVAIGDQEFPGGVQGWIDSNRQAGFWKEDRMQSTFPWLSGSYRLRDGPDMNRLLAHPWQMVELNGVNIGIISVTGPEAFRFSADKLIGVDLVPPLDTIETFLRNYADRVDFVIVLSHQGIEADRLLANELVDIDLIIGGHSQSLISPPEMVNGIPIVQAGRNGENLGILRIEALPEKNSVLRQSVPSDHNPFLATVTDTTRWRMVQRLVPLDTTIDEHAAIGTLIANYRVERDDDATRLLSERVRTSDEGPHLIMHDSNRMLSMRHGETKEIEVQLQNAGNEPLQVENVRSRIRWMEVLDYPEMIQPGTQGVVRFLIRAENIDRHFHCEFSILSNDPERRVARGAFQGIIEGEMAGMVDVGSLWNEIKNPTIRFPEVLEQDDMKETEEIPRSGILLEYFYSLGCPDCEEFRNTLLPEIQSAFGEWMIWKEYDIGDPANYALLEKFEHHLGMPVLEPVTVFIDRTLALAGLETLRRELFDVLAEQLSAEMNAHLDTPSNSSSN